jgi:hypothetical protein
MKKRNIGSTFDSFLREEGMYEEVSAAAIKRVVARQVEDAMKTKRPHQVGDGTPHALQPRRARPAA